MAQDENFQTTEVKTIEVNEGLSRHIDQVFSCYVNINYKHPEQKFPMSVEGCEEQIRFYTDELKAFLEDVVVGDDENYDYLRYLKVTTEYHKKHFLPLLDNSLKIIGLSSVSLEKLNSLREIHENPSHIRKIRVENFIETYYRAYKEHGYYSLHRFPLDKDGLQNKQLDLEKEKGRIQSRPDGKEIFEYEQKELEYIEKVVKLLETDRSSLIVQFSEKTVNQLDFLREQKNNEKSREIEKVDLTELFNRYSLRNNRNNEINMAQNENIMIPDETTELTQDEVAQTVGGVEVSPFNDKLIGIAHDLAIEFTVGGDRFDRDDIALALYAAGLKAEQLPAYRDYIRKLPQCGFPYEVDIKKIIGDNKERVLQGLRVADASYSELAQLEKQRDEHVAFIEKELNVWLSDDVVEKGEILDKLISNSQENRLPFDGVYKVGNGLWAGFDMVWEDLGSNIIMDSNGKRLHEGEIFTFLQGSYPNNRLSPGYHVDDNGILTAVTGHLDDNGKVVSDGLFVLDTKTGESRSFDARECSAQLTKALEEAEKAGLGMEFTMSACMDLWNGEAADIDAAISTGLREWDIECPFRVPEVSRTEQELFTDTRAFVKEIFRPEEIRGDMKMYYSDDKTCSMVKIWAGSCEGKRQDYFLLIDNVGRRSLLVNGANYNGVRFCADGKTVSLDNPEKYRGHDPYLNFFDEQSRQSLNELCHDVDKALSLCGTAYHQFVYFPSESAMRTPGSSEGEYIEVFSKDGRGVNFAPLSGEHRAELVFDKEICADRYLNYDRYNSVMSGFTLDRTGEGLRHGEPFMMDVDRLEVFYPDRTEGQGNGQELLRQESQGEDISSSL